VQASLGSLRASLGQLTSALHSVLHALLKGPTTRPQVLDWIAKVLKINMGRSKMNIDVFRNATHGFFCNLSVVMLKLCSPFMDPTKADRMARVDFTYVTASDRVDFSEETKLAASLDEAAKWVDPRNSSRIDNVREMQQIIERREMARVGSSSGAGSSEAPARPESAVGVGADGGGGGFHFICECYFFTATTLHLGLMKVISECFSHLQDMQRHQRSLQDLERLAPGGSGNAQVEAQMAELKSLVARGTEKRMEYETVIQDPSTLTSALGFARLSAALFIRLVSSPNTGKLQLPLPVPCPVEFALVPEFIVEDLADLLLYLSRFTPSILASEAMTELMDFLVVFSGSPLYVKNPYLRAKFLEVLRLWMPDTTQQGVAPPPESVVRQFEGNPVAVSHLVPHLLRLYVDIEFTGSHTQFYDKFNIRHNIGELLEYLWSLPSHQERWVRASQEDPGFYIRFINMLVNDAIYLLDESLKKLPEIKETEEAEIAAGRELNEGTSASAAQQRAQHERHQTLTQARRLVRSNLTLANVHIRMIHYTSAKVAAPFLLAEMVERIAGMLDYFLLYLAGPERKTLRIQDPERYGFRPKELLTMIADIYLNLTAGDSEGVFQLAVARDARSYRPEVFAAAAQVLRQNHLLPDSRIQVFEAFAESVHAAALLDREEEEAFGDIPEEFLDPIQCTIMKDPVTLPTSGQVLDRATIQRHLLSEHRDPFSRALLTVDMLEPNTELKEKIEAWVTEQKSHKKIVDMDTS